MMGRRDDEAILRPGVIDPGVIDNDGPVILGILRQASICVAALLLCTVAARADYKAGQAAWDAGRHGEAVTQWRAAARAKDVRAMLALGRAFARGLGAPQDYIEAHKWLNLAAGLGVAEAVAERDALAAEMTVEERAEARKLARAWRIGATQQKPKRALREAQGLLALLGYTPGPADGVWRPDSAQAYRTFLGKAGMTPGGALTLTGLRALRRAAKDKAAAARSAVRELHRAVQAGDIDGLKAVLTAGANTNARDRRGWTALMHAANKGYKLLVPSLLGAKADPDVRAADGATALFMAAAHGHAEIISLLMKAGADISVKGPKGRTAADVARLRFGNAAAARKKGADLAVLALLSGKKYAEATASPAATEAVLALSLQERRAIQTGLAEAGFKPGPANGVFGPATRAALRGWQKKAGKVATGHLTATAASGLKTAGARALKAADEKALTTPKCAGMGKGARCWNELANKPGCYIFDPYYNPPKTATWSGACAGGVAAGRGTWGWKASGGSGEATGTLVRGKQHGRWVSRHANGTVQEGPYVDGKRHGRFVERFASGGRFESEYRNGSRDGQPGVHFSKSGKRYPGRWSGDCFWDGKGNLRAYTTGKKENCTSR